ncbi:MAG: hypothetical protein XU15_C0004G0085 [candidate division NC10 bacterium CSP1-5]|nr:MAG: hypothetical protein XU15_C0004G0085 [candidate division NC10 bacterium CSP1-5]
MAPRMRRDQRIRDTHRARERQSLPVVTAHSPPHSSHLNGTILTLAIPSFTYSGLMPALPSCSTLLLYPLTPALPQSWHHALRAPIDRVHHFCYTVIGGD